MLKNKIFVIGGNGLLGSCFKKVFPLITFSVGRNLKNDYVIDKNIFVTLEKICSPGDLIIHSAWDINLKKWEENHFIENYFINFSENIFSFSQKRNIKCIFISTDQVYDGIGPHKEGYEISPLNNYGRVKLYCENLALKYNVIISRINFLTTDPTKNEKGWVESLIKRATNNNKIILFDNVYFSPCSGLKAAEIIYKLSLTNSSGIFNIGCREKFTKSYVALKILNYKNLTTKNIQIKSVDKFPDNIKRSKDLSMNVEKIEKKLNLNLETKEELIKNIFI